MSARSVCIIPVILLIGLIRRILASYSRGLYYAKLMLTGLILRIPAWCLRELRATWRNSPSTCCGRARVNYLQLHPPPSHRLASTLPGNSTSIRQFVEPALQDILCPRPVTDQPADVPADVPVVTDQPAARGARGRAATREGQRHADGQPHMPKANWMNPDGRHERRTSVRHVPFLNVLYYYWHENDCIHWCTKMCYVLPGTGIHQGRA